MLPLQSSARKFDGVMVMTLDVIGSIHCCTPRSSPRAAVAGIFDSAGTLIASNNQAAAETIFGARVRAASAEAS